LDLSFEMVGTADFSAGFITADEIRLGTTFADVVTSVPEPSAVVLCGRVCSPCSSAAARPERERRDPERYADSAEDNRPARSGSILCHRRRLVNSDCSNRAERLATLAAAVRVTMRLPI
jgi:hypothetical protein